MSKLLNDWIAADALPLGIRALHAIKEEVDARETELVARLGIAEAELFSLKNDYLVSTLSARLSIKTTDVMRDALTNILAEVTSGLLSAYDTRKLISDIASRALKDVKA